MTINRKDLQEAIKCVNWQCLREALKGRPTIIKLETVKDYVTPTTWANDSKTTNVGLVRFDKTCCTSYQRQLQVVNYLTALSRGGLIEPIPRAWQWPEHIKRWLAEKRYVIKGEG